ncbi:MAG: hypothetical protein J1E64_07755 [Acetatifactor sp.]|nr:hypothetical protein [Acetatifactor sp.]
MNKDLEKEYKELMTENVPDLWERIEAGLEPKQPTAKRGNLWKRYRMWGLAAAACLCLMATAPVILREITDRSIGSGSSPAYDGGMAGGSQNAAENAGTALETPSEEDAVMTYIVMGTVTEVSEEEGRRVYIVEISRTDLTELSAGDSIMLYGDRDFNEEIWEGEEYLFDIVVSIDDNGTTEYLIEDIW